MAVLSNIYPSATNEPTGPFIKRGTAVSVQTAVLSGSGAVGSYQLETSNDDDAWVSQGSAINTATITEFATVIKQKVRVRCVTPPDSGTVVKVTIYGDAPGE